MQKIYAPFNQEQIKSLNEFQQSGYWHEFTCGNCRSTLEATETGWICKTEDCGYTQDWCHDFMQDGSWQKQKELIDSLKLFKREYGYQ